MGLGFIFGLGYNGGQVQTVHATMDNVAASELKIELSRVDGKPYTTFAGGRYLHISPAYNTVEANNSSAGADMEYDESTGVLKINDTDNIDEYDGKISLYGLNSTDKQLTIEYHNIFDFYVLAFEKGNLTLENVTGKDISVGWGNKFKINGELTIRGNTSVMPILAAIGYNYDVNNIIEAGTLKLLGNSSLYYRADSSDDIYSIVYVNSLVLNTDGELYLDAKKATLKNNGKVLYASDVTLTKVKKITLVSPDNYDTTLTNSTYLRNAPTSPIPDYYSVIIQEDYYGDYIKTYYLISNSTYFTVSFNKNGGTGTMAPVENVNGTFVLPECTFAPPTGYGDLEFQCWSDKTSGGNTYAEGDSYTLVGNITFYAKWITATNHNVSFNANGGTGSMAGGSYLGAYTLPACTITAPSGKQFKCWALNSADATTQFNAGDTYYLHKNVTFYPVWEDLPRAFTTQPQGAIKEVGQNHTATWITNFDVLEYEVCEWTGSNWNVIYDYDGSAKTAGTEMSYNFNSNVAASKKYYICCYYDLDYYYHVDSEEFTITWQEPEPITYTVSFNSNGGSGTMSAVDNVSGSYTLPANGFTAPEHKHFAGWALTSNGAVIDTLVINITANTELFAIWEEDATYTVEYHANGSESVDHLDGGIYAGTYSLKTVQQVGFVAPSGKQFKGWSYTSNGEIINTPTITIDGNKELYAIWEDIPAEQYTISFNNNGGSGEIANVQYGGTYTLPTTCSFTAPEGKEFAGWALSENGEKITTATIQITANTQLFALWKDIEADPEPEVEPEPAKAGLPAGAVVAIVIASVLVAGVGGFAVVWFVVKKKTWADFVQATKNVWNKMFKKNK